MRLNLLFVTFATNLKHLQNSLTIKVSNAGKKYGREWIFRNVDMEIKPGDKLVILGLNGSGKSTLLQAMTGYLSLNEGNIVFENGGQLADTEKMHEYVSLASPYLELVEDFSLREQINHVSIYKPFLKELTTDKIVELSGLAAHQNKYIKLFSSGMRQRLKLTLAILADAPILFLDEPTTNLDATVIHWYKELIDKYAQNKTIVVCSNSIKDEYVFCNREIRMENFKNSK